MGSSLALISLRKQNKCNGFFGESELSWDTILKHAQWTKGLQKVVIWFLDADDDPDSHQNLIITFWPIYNVP